MKGFMQHPVVYIERISGKMTHVVSCESMIKFATNFEGRVKFVVSKFILNHKTFAQTQVMRSIYP